MVKCNDCRYARPLSSAPKEVMEDFEIIADLLDDWGYCTEYSDLEKLFNEKDCMMFKPLDVSP